MIQDLPIRFSCEKPVDHDAVFAPPVCEHPECSSVVFHGLCLMRHREWLAERRRGLQEARARHERGECGCPSYQPDRPHEG